MADNELLMKIYGEQQKMTAQMNAVEDDIQELKATLLVPCEQKDNIGKLFDRVSKVEKDLVKVFTAVSVVMTVLYIALKFF